MATTSPAPPPAPPSPPPPPPPPLTTSAPPPDQLVLRFLATHLASNAIEPRTHAKLHRMIQIISAIGRELHTLLSSEVALVGAVRRVEWYAWCLLDGCGAFRRVMEGRVGGVRKAVEGLLEFDDGGGVGDEEVEERVRELRGVLSTLHVPTGNDARLFRHLLEYYDDKVYSQFEELHRQEPQNLVRSISEHLTAIAYCLTDICTLCNAVDSIVEELEFEYATLLDRAHQLAAMPSVKPRTKGKKEASATRPALRIDVAAAQGHLRTSPIPDEPPRLPPLPFQQLSADEMLHPSKSAPIPGGDGHVAAMTKSFSVVEDQIHPRKHFRSATVDSTGYVTGTTGAIGLGIAGAQGAQAPETPGRRIRAKASESAIPRVFETSFASLLERARQLELMTPEAQPSTPVHVSSVLADEDPVKVRDFGDTSETPSLCPSPVTLLFRREALVSRDVQWESRVLGGEIVRSRRPSEKLHLQGSRIGDDGHGRSFDGWLSSRAAPPVERSAPGTPSTAVKRGLLRQRENTL
ncbi:hypothetical protein LTR91_020402 [Friedmanniomyces endolithicus]|uniref:Uncharacterized protein n=1 Tax=Friedmanniomyces endolithicus TaxID=329885 RepID=A0AAN6H8R8_9PEZI|nr:hypothetical protein LTR94_016479 [Friedmanniomyces endolithicus]KAK0786952.1 hypothetical protein LTR75_013042 [Friedmanniomyces endolithicus]KAK0799884.1 hypothetical protein LTR59_005944 [Friedmanniomyces endolithicus]KAK0820267.1 hypothetical protein LTR38_000176 [Friedmanniomyces endolithicus]KAK0850997.1 hypothetical protein LTR03_004287 [Friedmanniomyces endolithicus]